MTWFRLDDQFHDQPKVVAAGNAAIGLYCRLGTWCADKLTDGFIPEAIAKSKGTPKELKALTACPIPDTRELLTIVDGGYLMRDYLLYNPTRQAVLVERAKAKARMDKLRGRSGVGSGEQTANTHPNFAGGSGAPDPDPLSTEGCTERPDDSTCPAGSPSVSPQRIKATAKALAELQWAQRNEAGLVDKNKRTGWVGVAHRGILDERSDEIVHLLGQGLEPGEAAQQMHAPKLTLVVSKPDVPTVKCPTCDGTKNVHTGAGYVQCPECKGAGKVPESIDPPARASGGNQ